MLAILDYLHVPPGQFDLGEVLLCALTLLAVVFVGLIGLVIRPSEPDSMLNRVGFAILSLSVIGALAVISVAVATA
ncbi:MAG: hypothetical protein IPM64_07955 [Phycisphaerales bacterium]|nr:hypothetical protein [Phycisphaerales bacterium]